MMIKNNNDEKTWVKGNMIDKFWDLIEFWKLI
jgi:hypothetical protein